MNPKTKKILIWTGVGIVSAIGIVLLISSFKPNTNIPSDEFSQKGDEDKNSGTGFKDGDSSLKNCGTVKTDYDRDFDYKKCDGIWYTKSKPTGSKASVYPNWVSLSNNALATQRLNTKYPNG